MRNRGDVEFAEQLRLGAVAQRAPDGGRKHQPASVVEVTRVVEDRHGPWGDSGTRCSSFAFIRAAGTVQVAAWDSTSSQRVPRTRLERHTVSTRHSKASGCYWVRVRLTDSRECSTPSPCGSASRCFRRVPFFGSATEMVSPARLSSR